MPARLAIETMGSERAPVSSTEALTQRTAKVIGRKGHELPRCRTGDDDSPRRYGLRTPTSGSCPLRSVPFGLEDDRFLSLEERPQPLVSCISFLAPSR